MNNQPNNQILKQERNFLFMVGYRWASLIPVLLTPPTREQTLLPPLTILGIALLINIIITIFHKRLNERVNKMPTLMVIDLVFMAGILTLSGGADSPYFFYGLSPLLASAFFFGVKGGVFNTTLFTPLFIIGEMIVKNYIPGTVQINQVLSALAQMWLMTLLFGYSSILLRQLNQTHEELQLASEDVSLSHKQLKIVHELTLLIQSATDIQSVQTQVLKAVTQELGYPCAVVGLVDPVSELLGNWASYPEIPLPEEGLPALPLSFQSGPLLEKLFKKEVFYFEPGSKLTNNPKLNSWLENHNWIALPMILQDHSVGVLMIEIPEERGEPDQEEVEVLKSVSNQAAVGLGTTLMCIDRARNLAIEQERNRFAREIHDTVAQSLFGMTYSLEAVANMLGDDNSEIKKELIEIQEMANTSREEIRNSIFNMWPSQLTLERFVSDLTLYAKQFCRPRNFLVNFNTAGDFDVVPQGIRRSLYRIAQEALTNATQHADVTEVDIDLKVSDGKVYMQIKDAGQGFDPEIVMNRAYNRERFGLHGIKERVLAINGEFLLESKKDKGTRLEVTVPLNVF